jgi:ATPase subunit of ABC transporter with duplicated ATPase domains
MQPKIRRKIATDIRDIKSRVVEVHDRRRRYEVNHSVDRPVKVDPHALVRYEKLTNLVGINEARDEVTKILIEGSELLKQQGKIVSIVGFGGLGKTTLANVVYEKLRGQFDCSAFVAMSQTPDMDQLFKDMFYQLAKKYSTASINNVISELREFLRRKRYEHITTSSYINLLYGVFI